MTPIMILPTLAIGFGAAWWWVVRPLRDSLTDARLNYDAALTECDCLQSDLTDLRSRLAQLTASEADAREASAANAVALTARARELHEALEDALAYSNAAKIWRETAETLTADLARVTAERDDLARKYARWDPKRPRVRKVEKVAAE